MWNQYACNPWIHGGVGYSDVRINFGPDLSKNRDPSTFNLVPDIRTVILRLPDSTILRTQGDVGKFLSTYYIKQGYNFTLPFYKAGSGEEVRTLRVRNADKSIKIEGSLVDRFGQILTSSQLEIPLETETGERVKEIRIIPHYNWVIGTSPYLDAQIQ